MSLYIVPMRTKQVPKARWRCVPINVKPEGRCEGDRSNHGNLSVSPVPRVGTLIVPYALRVGILILRDQGLKGIWGSSLAPGWEFWPIILFRSWTLHLIGALHQPHSVAVTVYMHVPSFHFFFLIIISTTHLKTCPCADEIPGTQEQVSSISRRGARAAYHNEYPKDFGPRIAYTLS